jgi:cell division protein FtsN
VYRIVLGTFETKESAYKAAKKAQSLNFKNVAIVRYEKGNRFESIYRGW